MKVRAVAAIVGTMFWSMAAQTASATPGQQVASAGDGVRAPATEPMILAKRSGLVVEESSLSDALTSLAESSGVVLAFSPSIVREVSHTVSCACRHMTVGETLSKLLRNTGLGFTEVRGQVMVYSVTSPTLESGVDLLRSLPVTSVLTSLPRNAEGGVIQPLSALTLRNQQNVAGTVTGPTGAPVVAARVSVKGTTVGTLTNSSGGYTIVAPNPTDTLVFSSLGFQEQEVPITGRAVIDVVLQETVLALEGLVVVGYGTQSRATVTGAVSSISSEAISRTSATTAAEALVGKIAGINTRLYSNNSGRTSGARDAESLDGRPGAPTSIQIRNMGAPLFVIDGVPSDESAFQQMNAADIENVSILKDASAAIYGFRAANGVVLVTTKSGASGGTRSQLRVDGYYGFQNLDRYPYEKMFNAYQFQRGTVESQQNRGQVRSIPAEELERWRVGTEPGYQSYDAYSAIVNNPNAAQYNINAALSGAFGTTTYYLSFGRVGQDYVMKDNSFSRNNLQMNISAVPLTNLTLDAKLRARQEFTTNFALTGSGDVVRTALLGVNSTWPTESPWADPEQKYIAVDQRYLARAPVSFNKKYSGWQDDTNWDFNGTFFAEYALPWSTRVRASYSMTANLRNFDQHRYSFDAYRYNPATESYEVAGSAGSSERYQSRVRGTNNWSQLMVTSAQRIGNHSFSGTVAYERNGGESWRTAVTSVPPGSFTHLIGLSDLVGLENAWNIDRRESYVGRFNYDYNQQYLVELLGRYEGSYLFPPDKRWGFFPGASVGWRISEEDFFRDRFSFINELKLRASWGETGREQTGQAWTYLGGATYGSGNAFLDGALVTGIVPRGLPVTNLSWVTSISRNIGLDHQWLDGRLSGEIDLFERKLTGLPAARYDVVIPTEVGYTLPNENLESEATRGIEAMIRYSGQFGSVRYSIAPHATLARNTVLERYKPRYGNSWDRYRTGTEHRWSGVTGTFGYETLGQFQTVEEIEAHAVNIDGQGNRSLLPGDLIYKDQNNDGIINAMDQRPIGFSLQGTPILSFGLNGTFDYGSFSLAYDFAGGALYSYLQVNEQRYAFFGDHNAQAFYEDRWRRADPYDDQSEWIPGRFPAVRKGVTNHATFQPTSDYWRHNVKYLRLKRLELAYIIPTDIASRAGMSSVRVYTSIANPFSLDNVKFLSLDPEIVQGNGLNYPTSTVLNFGFSATLGGGQ